MDAENTVPSIVLVLVNLNFGKATVVFVGSVVKDATGIGYASTVVAEVSLQFPAVLFATTLTLYLPWVG